MKTNILVVSQEVSFPSLWQHHDVLEFPPRCPSPGREKKINKHLIACSIKSWIVFIHWKTYQTCPLPCSWIAFWKICSLFPVSINSSIVCKNQKTARHWVFVQNSETIIKHKTLLSILTSSSARCPVTNARKHTQRKQ